MTSPKRSRGRPRGSGIDDMPALAKIADLLVRDASLKPTTAMKRVMGARKDWGASDETLLRRWQEKWKQQGDALLAAARKRARPKPAPVPMFLTSHFPAGQIAAMAHTSRCASMIDAATLRAASEHMRVATVALNSPAMKALMKQDSLLAKIAPAIKGMEAWGSINSMLRITDEQRRAIETLSEQQRRWSEIAKQAALWGGRTFLR